VAYSTVYCGARSSSSVESGDLSTCSHTGSAALEPSSWDWMDGLRAEDFDLAAMEKAQEAGAAVASAVATAEKTSVARAAAFTAGKVAAAISVAAGKPPAEASKVAGQAAGEAAKAVSADAAVEAAAALEYVRHAGWRLHGGRFVQLAAEQGLSARALWGARR